LDLHQETTHISYIELFSDCNEVAKNLEQIFDMQIGTPEPSSKGEWVIYNPLARAVTNMTGRATVDSTVKINASLGFYKMA
jgi:hypothetical protein